MLSELLNEILLAESASVENVNSAIDNHSRIIITYHTDGKDEATDARVIEVYAYGLSKSGNPVIRAFQPYGDTTSRVPSWKFFRLDRIDSWKDTGQHFSAPASDYYKGLGEFNKNGDKTMGIVYKVAKFGDEGLKNKGRVAKTDTEKRLERLRQQTKNPIMLSDLKAKTNAANKTEPAAKEEPKEPETFKTPTERGFEKLRREIANPRFIDLSKFDKYNRKKTKPEPPKVKEEPPIEEPAAKEEPKEPETFKTPTERGFEKLRREIANPRFIDLSKIPKR